MPRARRQMTWVEMGLRNAGFLKTQTALLWAMQWAVTRESIGSDPSVEEVAAWWNQNERTAYRQQAAFRSAFPTLESPAPIFADPSVRAKMETMAKQADDFAAQRKTKRRIPESIILELGFGRAIS